jgi:hypothetical protein
MGFLTRDEAKKLVENYMSRNDAIYSTQQILDSGAIPRLKGFIGSEPRKKTSYFSGEMNFWLASGV